MRHILATLTLSLILPTFAVLLPLLFLYRQTIIFINSALLRFPFKSESVERVKAIQALDYILSLDTLYSSPKGSISFIWIAEGGLRPEVVKERLENALKVAGYDCEKLTCLYPTFWAGVPFWTKCKLEFSIHKHLNVIHTKFNFVGERELNCYLVERMRSPFKEELPLWDISVVPNITLEGRYISLLIFRIHHMIGDGLSMLQLLQRITDEPGPYPGPLVIAKEQEKNLKQRMSFGDVLHVPFVIWKLFQDFFLHSDVWTGKKTTSEVVLFTKTIPLEKFARIRTHLVHPSPPSFLILGVSTLFGVLRNIHASSKAHSNVVLALPHQAQAHPGANVFCNSWTQAILNVELAEGVGSLSRLRRLQRKYDSTVNERGWARIWAAVILPALSLTPSWLWEKVVRYNMGAAIGSTNMVGPRREVRVGGSKVLLKYAYVGLLWRHSTLTSAFFSYNGNLSLAIVGNRDLFKEEDQLGKRFEEELDKLLEESGGGAIEQELLSVAEF